MRPRVSVARGPSRVLAVVLTAIAMVLSSMAFGQLQAGAQTVGNPGEFAMEIIGGEIAIKDTSFDLEPSELPACSDGEDNDEDGQIDYPADPQCTAPDDNSELAGGHQPKQDISITGTIDADGNINVPTSGVFFPPTYIAGPSLAPVITVRIQPTHAATGTLDPTTGEANIRVRVRIKLEGGSGLTSLGSNCFIGSSSSPIDLNLITGTTAPPAPNEPISGVPYDAETGVATMVNNSFNVVGASGCGLFNAGNGPINDELGLPSTAGNNTAVLVGQLSPVIVPPAPANAAPTASFVADPTSGTAPLEVSFDASASEDSDGEIVSYEWDFGDGNSGEGANATHTYEEAGTYEVTLTVTDDDGATATATETIEVAAAPVNEAPTAVISAVPTSGDAPLEVSFDGSGSSDPDGEIVSYEWDFGDGNSGEGANATHTYEEAGTYEVTLTVTDDQGATGTATASIVVSEAPVNQAPVASLVLDPTSGVAPLTVSADASGSFDPDGEIVLYSYSMTGTTLGGDPVDQGPYDTPDETSGQFEIPEPGSYTVTLVVTDDGGLTDSMSVDVEVTEPAGNEAPTAVISAVPTSGTAPLEVSFDGSGSSDPDGEIVSYEWDFGDGNSGEGANVTHTYEDPGTYEVTLTVTDDQGATAVATETIEVDAVPVVSDTVHLRFTGAVGYEFDGPITDGNLRIDRDLFGVSRVSGTASIPGANSGTATVRFNLNRFLVFNAFSGQIRVTDTSVPGMGTVTTEAVLIPLSTPNKQAVRGTANWNLGFDANFKLRNYTLRFTVEDRA